VLEVHYLLPDGIICLLHAFSDTSSVSSIASPCEGFRKLLALVLGILKFSLYECTEFIILRLITSGAWFIVLPPLGEIWKSSLTAYATTTTTENNHNKAGGNHTYI
jgi:hypothetical protein